MSERERMGGNSCVPGFGRDRRELWGQLYAEHHDMVRRYFAVHLSCSHDVEDLIQSVFAKLVRCGRIPEDPKTYIYTAAQNQLRSYWWQKKRREEQVLSSILERDGAVISPSLCLDPFEQVQNAEERRTIEQAIRRLPPMLACVLRLRIIQGLSLDETALKVGCSREAVKKRLQRAKRSLLESYRQVEDEQPRA